MAKKIDPDRIKEVIARELAKTDPDWRLVENVTKSAVEADPENVRFTVDAGHIQRLGAELVGKQDTALSELIKNSFDSDATEVRLKFSYQDRMGGTLVIEDNGSGMTDDVIRESWMRISTDAKISAPVSPRFGRARAGRKGIGRFSVQRLGKSLRFEKEPDDHGTKLSIFDLRDPWSDYALERVWRSVLLLQPPFPVAKTKASKSIYEADPGFSVVINGKSRDQVSTEYSIESRFLSQAIAIVEAEIDQKGVATFRVRAEKLGLNDKQIVEEKYPAVGAVKLSAHYFIYLPGTLSGMSPVVAAEMGRQYGGIRIYRNGFRVLPYGERRDDWLELDRDTSRRALLVAAANLNFFGEVQLSTDENPDFEETSSREGLVENPAYFQLKDFARAALEWAAKRVAAVRKRKQTSGQRDFIAETRRPSEVLTDVINKISAGNATAAPTRDPTPDLKIVQKIIADFEQATVQKEAEALEYQEMLRLLASLGLSISVFGHEVKGARESVRAHVQVIAREIAKVNDAKVRASLDNYFDRLGTAMNRVFDVGGYIGGLMSSTESRDLQTLSVSGALEQFADQFEEYMSKQGVEIDVDKDIPPSIRTMEMHASELDAVLLNFLTNSIKSMRLAQTEHRKVRITAERDGNHVLIIFEDNGAGIAPEIEDRIFDAFFTTTSGASDDGIAGPGTGLGLRIVSDIAESYGGDVTVGKPSHGYNCRMEFRILAARAK